VFATHDAADGALARVRLPGGAISAARLRVLADCSDDLGDGALHLTSRGNLQLRGLKRDSAELIKRLSDAGLLPSPAHERVRNVLASPLSGLTGGVTDVSGLAAELDAAICARPELAELPGRFLFALDDGRGDVAAEGADVTWFDGVLLLAGAESGVRVSDAVDAMLRVASAFAAVRGSAWRVRELPDPWVLLDGPREAVTLPSPPPVPIGAFDTGSGTAIGLAPPFGRLSAAQARLLADLAPRVIVTPWRSIVLPDTAATSALVALVVAGLMVDPSSPSLQVSACIGRPGCAKSRADVRADALWTLGGLPSSRRAHFSGCERRCGRPAADHLDVVAEDGGYRVDDVWVPLENVRNSLTQGSGS
jgi:precorrin-3B synthase